MLCAGANWIHPEDGGDPLNLRCFIVWIFPLADPSVRNVEGLDVQKLNELSMKTGRVCKRSCPRPYVQ